MDIFSGTCSFVARHEQITRRLILTRIIEIWYILCRKAVVKIIFY